MNCNYPSTCIYLPLGFRLFRLRGLVDSWRCRSWRQSPALWRRAETPAIATLLGPVSMFRGSHGPPRRSAIHHKRRRPRSHHPNHCPRRLPTAGPLGLWAQQTLGAPMACIVPKWQCNSTNNTTLPRTPNTTENLAFAAASHQANRLCPIPPYSIAHPFQSRVSLMTSRQLGPSNHHGTTARDETTNRWKNRWKGWLMNGHHLGPVGDTSNDTHVVASMGRLELIDGQPHHHRALCFFVSPPRLCLWPIPYRSKKQATLRSTLPNCEMGAGVTEPIAVNHRQLLFQMMPRALKPSRLRLRELAPPPVPEPSTPEPYPPKPRAVSERQRLNDDAPPCRVVRAPLSQPPPPSSSNWLPPDRISTTVGPR